MSLLPKLFGVAFTLYVCIPIYNTVFWGDDGQRGNNVEGIKMRHVPLFVTVY